MTDEKEETGIADQAPVNETKLEADSNDVCTTKKNRSGPKIKLTFIEPTYSRARVSKLVLCGKDGHISKVSGQEYNLGEDFKINKVTAVADLDGLKKMFDKMDSEKVIRIFGEPKSGLSGPIGPIVKRRKEVFPDPPDGTYLLMIDADGWNLQGDIFNSSPKSLRTAIDGFFTKHNLYYLCNKDMLVCFSSSAQVCNTGRIDGPFHAHIYMVLDKPLALVELRGWAAAVNGRSEGKIIDGQMFVGVQPDFFQKPVFQCRSKDPFQTKRRILVPGSGDVKAELLVGETTSAQRTISARIRCGENWSGSDKGKTWGQTCKRFGHKECHAVERAAAAQLVFEMGTRRIEEDIEGWSAKLHDKCWEHYGDREDGIKEQADREKYDNAKFRGAITSALYGKGFGQARDMVEDLWNEIKDDDLLTSEARELLDDVAKVPTWAPLHSAMTDRYDKRIGGPGKDALKQAQRRAVGITANSEVTPVYVKQYHALHRAGFKFFCNGEKVVVRIPGADNYVGGENEYGFIRLANQVLIEKGMDDNIITRHNQDTFLSYVAGAVIDNVPVAVRTYRDEDADCVWLDHGSYGKVYRIHAEPDKSGKMRGRVTLLDRKQAEAECPVRFVNGLGAPFPEVTQGEIDSALALIQIAGSIGWSEHRSRFRAGCVLSGRSMKTIFSFQIHSILDYGEFAVLHLIGDPGSGKSYLGAEIIWNFDPRYGDEGRDKYNHNYIVGGFPIDAQSLALTSREQFTIGGDNVNSSESVDNKRVLSQLTTLATGKSFKARKFYSQSETVTFKSVNPVIVTGLVDLVKVDEVHDDLLTRMYPIKINKKLNRVGKRFRDTITGDSQKKLFLETLAAAAYVYSKVGYQWKSEHRVNSFGDVMDTLFPGLGDKWMQHRFRKMERIKFNTRYAFVQFWIDKAKTMSMPWSGTASDIENLVGGLGSANKIGRVLHQRKAEIERLFEVKLTFVRKKGSRMWSMQW